ncbi:TetR/AcrR family transcriptional regulator [Subtercola sp. YIM 133946]|uniref:TetR/AcrR family transcriptional regulator n=1 Tax=Subtercola sp. YIM 133946 TaxID=3118909 RepID=UPI002F934EF8
MSNAGEPNALAAVPESAAPEQVAPGQPVAGGAAPRSIRRRDPDATKQNILEVATAEFADRGYSGAGVDDIADRTHTTKRMIYYYFGSKEGLYLAVLERAYEVIRDLEQTLDVTGMPPVQGLRRLAEFTYDHHTSHRDFVRLVSIENTHRAEHLSRSTSIPALNSRAIETLTDVLERGIAEGVFRSDLSALDVHMLISSYPIFHVANRYTFRALFDLDMLDPAKHDHYRRLAGDMVVATLTAGAPSARPLPTEGSQP